MKKLAKTKNIKNKQNCYLKLKKTLTEIKDKYQFLMWSRGQ